MSMLRLIAFLILSGSVFGQDIEAVIVPSSGLKIEDVNGVPTVTVKSSQMVKLRAGVKTTSTAGPTITVDTETQAKLTAYRWRLASAPAEYDVREWTSADGREVTFAAGNLSKSPKGYEFWVTIARNVGTETPPLVIDAAIVIRVEPANCPPETPGPTPDDPKEPPQDDPGGDDVDGIFGIAPALRDKIVELVPKNERWLALQFSAAYADVAKQVADGTIQPSAAGATLKEKNSAILKTQAQRDAWNPVIDWLSKRFQSLQAAGKFGSAAEVSIALAESSLGFALSIPLKGD